MDFFVGWTPPLTFDFELALSDFSQGSGCARGVAPLLGRSEGVLG